MTTARQTSRAAQSFSLAAAVVFVLIMMAVGYRAIGLPPVVIVGGSGVVGFVMWYFAGMYTAVLPMIPGVYAIYRVIKASKDSQSTDGS